MTAWLKVTFYCVKSFKVKEERLVFCAATALPLLVRSFANKRVVEILNHDRLVDHQSSWTFRVGTCMWRTFETKLRTLTFRLQLSNVQAHELRDGGFQYECLFSGRCWALASGLRMIQAHSRSGVLVFGLILKFVQQLMCLGLFSLDPT